MSEKDVYLKHKGFRALLIPVGIALLVASYGVANFLMLLPAITSSDASVLATLLDRLVKIESDEYLDITFQGNHVLAPLAFVAFVTVGIVVLRYAHKDRESFMETYAFLDFTYTPEEIQRSRHKARKFWNLGVGFGVVAIGLFLWLFLSGFHNLGLGCGFTLAAFSAGFISHGVMSLKGIDRYIYNYDSLKSRSIYAVNSNVGGPDHDTIVKIKQLSMVGDGINRVILVVGFLLGVALYFLPTLKTPFYWIPVAAAFIADFLVSHYCVRKSMGLYKTTDSFKNNTAPTKGTHQS